MRTKICDWAGAIGLLVMLVMAVMPLFNMTAEWVRWVYAAATLVVLLSRLFAPCPADTLRVRRLHRISIVSALLFCASAAALFVPKWSTAWAASMNGNEWVAFLLAGAILHLYTSWMTERELKAEK